MREKFKIKGEYKTFEVPIGRFFDLYLWGIPLNSPIIGQLTKKGKLKIYFLDDNYDIEHIYTESIRTFKRNSISDNFADYIIFEEGIYPKGFKLSDLKKNIDKSGN